MNAPTKLFHCPLWPDCGCPDGTVASDCPGRIGLLELVSNSSGPGGPAPAAPLASPAAAVRGPDEDPKNLLGREL